MEDLGELEQIFYQYDMAIIRNADSGIGGFIDEYIVQNPELVQIIKCEEVFSK